MNGPPVILPRFPNGPLQRETPISRAFFYTFPSESPVNEPPPPCSPTGFLWREKLHLQSQWFIHSFISVRVPNKEPSHKNGENIWPPSTEPHVDRRPTYNGVQSGSPRGSFATLQSLPQCHAAFSTIPSTLAWVAQSPLASMCHSNSHQGVPSTTVTAFHMTQGRVEYESTIPRSTDDRLDLLFMNFSPQRKCRLIEILTLTEQIVKVSVPPHMFVQQGLIVGM